MSAAEETEVWERCRCDQWGRCLVDCPTAHLTWQESALYKRIYAVRASSQEAPKA